MKFITLKIISNEDGKVKMLGSHKARRIFRFLEADKSSNCRYKVHFNYGQTTNQGTYNNKTDAKEALQAFMEEDY